MTDHLFLPDARVTLCGVPLSTVMHTPLPTRLAHPAGVAPDEPCRECYRAGGVAVVEQLSLLGEG